MDLLYCSASLIVIDLELVGGGGGVFVEFYGVFFKFKLGIYTHLTFNQYIYQYKNI